MISPVYQECADTPSVRVTHFSSARLKLSIRREGDAIYCTDWTKTQWAITQEEADAVVLDVLIDSTVRA